MDTPTADDAAAGAPGVVLLGGKEYLCAPASAKTFVAARNYIRSKLKTPLAAVAEAFKDLPPSLRAEAIKAAVAQQAGGSEITDEAATDVMVSVAGCRFMAWLHMRPPLNPDLKRETLDSLITEDNYLDVLKQLDDATGVSQLAKGFAGN